MQEDFVLNKVEWGSVSIVERLKKVTLDIVHITSDSGVWQLILAFKTTIVRKLTFYSSFLLYKLFK